MFTGEEKQVIISTILYCILSIFISSSAVLSPPGNIMFKVLVVSSDKWLFIQEAAMVENMPKCELNQTSITMVKD